MKVEPVILDGLTVLLEPLRHAHLDGLCVIGLDPQVWEWTSLAFQSREALSGMIDQAVKGEEIGRYLSFAIVLRADGRIAGTTTLGPISISDRNAESGIWLGRDFWGRGINTEVKYLLLRHAFETLGLIRVEFRADPQNVRTQRAILGLGAKPEGLLRKQKITDRGRIRDTLVFSLIDDDWPAAKAALQEKLSRR